MHQKNRELARRWADRAVRIYAPSALLLAGFSISAGALATLPELTDDDSVREAKRRINIALDTVLLAGEIPRSEEALVATFAARAAVAMASHQKPDNGHLKNLVGALHAGAEASAPL